MAYSYDVFLSYASEDSLWADRLERDLTAKGLSVFRDIKRLRPGFKWELEIENALETSEHFVVLWTAYAKDSAWVPKEISEFRARADGAEHEKAVTEGRDGRQARELAPNSRRQLFINLANADHAYRSIQGIDELLAAGVYGAGFENLEAPGHRAAWDRTVKHVTDAVRDTDTRTPIPVTIVAMTEAECLGLLLDQTRGTPTSVAAALSALEIASKTDLSKRYGSTRREWRPFGGDISIERILDQVLDPINAKVTLYHRSQGLPPAQAAARGYRWEYVDFIDPTMSGAAVTEAMNGLISKPSAVILDPLSLYADNVFNRFHELSPCFGIADVVIAALGPFSAPVFTRLRDIVRNLTRPHLLPYFDPPIPAPMLALCGPTLQDESDLARLIATSLSRRTPTARGKGQLYTRIGRGR